MPHTIDLRDVTLCCVDCATPVLALRALRQSQASCCFGRSLLFTDQAVAATGVCTVPIAPLRSVADYSRFLLKDLAAHIKTDYALVVQWDGYVVHPGAWDDAFRDFDYIGAVWPWFKDHRQVGNGGFSWRSKKLLQALAQDEVVLSMSGPEDLVIGREARDHLEQRHAIRYAPVEVAHRFSYESTTPEFPSFGFHGIYNLWRHCEDTEAVAMLMQLPPRHWASDLFQRTLLAYFYQRKFLPVAQLYQCTRRMLTAQQFSQSLLRVTQDALFASQFPAYCEQLLQQYFASTITAPRPARQPPASDPQG